MDETTMEQVIGVIALLAGFVLTNVILGAIVILPTLKARRAKAWPTVSGQIIRSELTRGASSRGGTTNYANVHYSYRVMGQDYQSDQVSPPILPGGRTGGMIAGSIVNKYPLGSTVTVYYNPENPADALLEIKTSGIVRAMAGAWAFANVMFCCCGFTPMIGWPLFSLFMKYGMRFIFDNIFGIFIP
jgi:hypothetical protein